MSFLVKEIAKALDIPFIGNGDLKIESLASLDSAQSDQLSFLADKKYQNKLQSSQAGAVIIAETMREQVSGTYLFSQNPYLSYAKVSQLIGADTIPSYGVHERAYVHPSAEVASSASIGPLAVIEAGVQIGEGCVIGSGTVVGESAVIGDYTRLFSNVTIYHDCILGAHCRVQSGVIIGGDGFGYAPDNGSWARIAQLGRVIIKDRVEIGANTTIDRGTLGDTVIEQGVILDNLIMIAHNCRIGENTAMAGCVGVAGSTTIGKDCTIAGGCSINGHITIVDNVHLTATALVLRSISVAGRYSSGMPLQANRQWRRTFSRIAKLEDMAQKLRKL